MNSHLPIQGHRHEGHRHEGLRHDGLRRNRLNPSTRGAALMMTLIMLVLLSILITGFVVSMRTELKVAYANENIQRTKMVAQSAVSHGIDLLRANIPDPASVTVVIGDQADAPSRNWISNPGRLIVDLGGSNEQIVDLHTGTQNDGDDLTSFDLNEPLPGESAAAIVAVDTGPRPHMRVSWVDILEDPSRAAGATLENGDVNAVTGRYAFWMDDETSKLNFNVASGKNIDAWQWLADSWLVPNTVVPRGSINNRTGDYAYNKTYAVGHPATINLDHLFGEEGTARDGKLFDRGRLATHIYTNGWHRYPEAIMEYYDFDGDPEVIDPSEQEWYDKNKWNLTFYSRSPEFNVFGRSRFFTIFNPIALEGGPVYQMPFTSNGVLHLHTLMGGLEHAVTESAVNQANLNVLMEYFNRDDWPGYSGSFASKWGGNESAFQVALNIIQMGILASGHLFEGNNQPGSEHRFALDYARDVTDGTRNDPDENRRFPERDYWKDDQGNLYLPQSPGPHLTECHFDFFVEKSRPDFQAGNIYRLKYYNIGFRYSTEYFMHNWGSAVPTLATNATIGSPSAQISPFPTAIDFLRIKALNVDKFDAKDGGVEKQNPRNNWKNGIRGVRAGLFAQNWQNIHHRELIIDIAEDLGPSTISPKIFTIGPREPATVGNPPGLDRGNPNIKVAKSDKIYLPVSPNNGNFRNGFVTEEEIANGTSSIQPHEFVVRETLNPNNPNGEPRAVEGEWIQLTFDVRLGMAAPNGGQAGSNLAQFNRPKQMLPMGDTPTDLTSGGDLQASPDHVFSHSIDWPDIRDLPERSFGWGIDVEPRIARKKSDWGSGGLANEGPGDLGRVSFSYRSPAESKFRHLQIGWSPNSNNGNTFGDMLRIDRGDNLRARPRPQRGTRAYTENYRMSSPGYYSLIHTGQQVGEAHRSLSLLPKDKEPRSYQTGPPDYVLFDLFAPSFCLDGQQWTTAHRLPDSWSTISYMNSTAGQINLNSRIYPDDAGEDFNPPERIKPLEAVFVHLRNNKSWAPAFAEAIVAQQESQPFAYVGELAEVPGYLQGAPGNNPFRQEEILRNMMPSLTTKSNTFGLWGVAQTVRKSPANLDSAPDTFEEGDQVLGEKRFFALLERYVWPGRDGAPGNAHVDANGIWDKLAVPRLRTEGQISAGSYANILHDIPGAPPNINPNNNRRGSGISFAEMDGPDPVTMDGDAQLALANAPHSTSTLEEAYNPPHPVMKYRVVYFKYLDQ